MENSNQSAETTVAEYYEDYKQTQSEMIALYSKKTRNAIFTIAGLWLASDLLAMAAANVFSLTYLLTVLIVPVSLVVAGFLAMKQPLVAVILATVVFVGVWVLTIVLLGSAGAISGIILKAIIIYFLIAGFQNAREVEKTKKEIVN